MGVGSRGDRGGGGGGAQVGGDRGRGGAEAHGEKDHQIHHLMHKVDDDDDYHCNYNELNYTLLILLPYTINIYQSIYTYIMNNEQCYYNMK